MALLTHDKLTLSKEEAIALNLSRKSVNQAVIVGSLPQGLGLFITPVPDMVVSSTKYDNDSIEDKVTRASEQRIPLVFTNMDESMPNSYEQQYDQAHKTRQLDNGSVEVELNGLLPLISTHSQINYEIVANHTDKHILAGMNGLVSLGFAILQIVEEDLTKLMHLVTDEELVEEIMQFAGIEDDDYYN